MRPLRPLLVTLLTAHVATAAAAGSVHESRTADGRKACTVYAAAGNETTRTDDTPTIVAAFASCGRGGRVVFPANQTYWIASKLNPVVEDVDIEWRGTWQFSTDLAYWRNSNNTYPIAFQNHHAAFVLTGHDIRLAGHGTGGIHGGGDAWYTAEAGTTLPGRPMPFVLWNVSRVLVSDFRVLQPALWAFNLMNATDVTINNLLCNATAADAPFGENWVQNTDGFDTMDARRVRLDGFVYQGGDDCVAIKPRSYDVQVRNASCHGGNGIAVGSLGQYLEDASVEDLLFDGVRVVRRNDDLENAGYVKTWVGVPVYQDDYESGYRARGGGWGVVRNVTFANFALEGPSLAAAISQNSGDNGTFGGTSRMEVSDVRFVNFTGYSNTTGTTVAEVSCSDARPCRNITFADFLVAPGENGTVGQGVLTCEYVDAGAVSGLNCTS